VSTGISFPSFFPGFGGFNIFAEYQSSQTIYFLYFSSTYTKSLKPPLFIKVSDGGGKLFLFHLSSTFTHLFLLFSYLFYFFPAVFVQ